MKFIGIIAMLSLIHIETQAQANKSSLSCCQLGQSSTLEFVSLSKEEGFKLSHLNPKPFKFVSKNGKMISFKAADGIEAKAFWIKSKKATKNVIFVIQEWWGLNDYIKQEAEKIQQELDDVDVYALDMYDGKVATTREDAAKYMQEADEDRLKAILSGAISHVGKDAKIGTVGWCFGGGLSLQASLMAENQAVACVMYYGMPEKNVAKLQLLNAPVFAIFAKQDGWITPAIADEFEKKMKEVGKSITIRTYDADHAFANPSNPKFNKEAAEDAHKASIVFFKSQFGIK